MNSNEPRTKAIKKYIFLYYLFIFITFINLVLKINSELSNNYYFSLNEYQVKEQNLFDYLKKSKNLGWFNLDQYYSYKFWTDTNYLSFQYMIAPTILDNYAYENLIICYYSSPKQLESFCQRNKKYKLIRKDIFYYFALLERTL